VPVTKNVLLRAALPAAALLGATTLIGPLVFAASAGMVFAGFFATAALLPLFMFAGVGAAFLFGTFATVGAVFFLPTMVSCLGG